MEGTRVNHLEEDSKVEVHGLVSQTALNGRRGTVVGMRNKQGRWPVVLDPDTRKSARCRVLHHVAKVGDGGKPLPLTAAWHRSGGDYHKRHEHDPECPQYPCTAPLSPCC